MTPEEFEKAILTIYLDDQEECNSKFGGVPMHYTISAERLQKEMWKRYRVSRKDLLIGFEQFFENQPYPQRNEIWSVFVAGGPCNAYKKSNWVEVKGRHYLQIGIGLDRYHAMRQREMVEKTEKTNG